VKQVRKYNLKKLVEMRKWFIHNLKNNSPGIVAKQSFRGWG
jgi:hypothetical protein